MLYTHVENIPSIHSYYVHNNCVPIYVYIKCMGNCILESHHNLTLLVTPTRKVTFLNRQTTVEMIFIIIVHGYFHLTFICLQKYYDSSVMWCQIAHAIMLSVPGMYVRLVWAVWPGDDTGISLIKNRATLLLKWL